MADQARVNETPNINDVLSDSTASLWHKAALCFALCRDPVDATNDSELLARLLERRCTQIWRRAEEHFVSCLGQRMPDEECCCGILGKL